VIHLDEDHQSQDVRQSRDVHPQAEDRQDRSASDASDGERQDHLDPLGLRGDCRHIHHQRERRGVGVQR